MLNHITLACSDPPVFYQLVLTTPEDRGMRSQDYAARVSIVTTLVPEERYVIVFGLRTLPRKLEEEFGSVESLQGLQRERWNWYG